MLERKSCVNFQVDLLETTDLANSDPDDSVTEPTLQSIIGNSQKYTPEIRKLYYNLLADQVPISKINDIIRHVLRCFNPTENVKELQLPKSSCAAYMRKKGIKDYLWCPQSNSDFWTLITIEAVTSQNQKKIGGVVAKFFIGC